MRRSYPREKPPYTRTADTAPAGTAAPTTTDTGNTVPQRANPTQTAYTLSRERAPVRGESGGRSGGQTIAEGRVHPEHGLP